MVIASLGELSYKITLDSTDFDKALKSTQKEMGPGGSLTNSIASGVFSGNASLDILKAGINAIGDVANFAMDTAKAAFDSFSDTVQKGADFAMLDSAVKQVGANAGISSQEIDKMVLSLADTNTYGSDALNVIRSLTVTGLLPMVQGFSKIDTSSGKTMKGLDAFTMVAKDFGATMGINSSDAIQTLTTAIIKMRPQLLDQLGIQINLNKAYQDYGATIGKTGPSLTMAERQQAMLMAIMEQGEKVAGTYSATYDTMGKNLLSLQSVFKSITEYLGYGFAIALTPATGAILDITKGALALMILFKDEYLKYIPQINSAWENLGNTLLGFSSALGITGPGVDGMAKSLGDLAGTATINAIGFLNDFFNGMASNAPAIKQGFDHVSEAIGALTKKSDDAKEPVDKLAKSLGQQTSNTIALALEILAKWITDLAKPETQLKIQKTVDSILTIADALQKVTGALADVEAKWGAVSRTLNTIGKVASYLLFPITAATDLTQSVFTRNTDNFSPVSSSGLSTAASALAQSAMANQYMSPVTRASGGDLGNGATVVGENGPEVIYKDHVYPSSMTSQMKTGGGTIQNVFNIDKGVDVDAFANRLNFQLRYLL